MRITHGRWKKNKAEYMRQWRLEHRDRLREQLKRWHKDNPDKQKEYTTRTRTRPRYIWLMLVKSCVHRGHVIGITYNSFKEWYGKQEKICSYCGVSEEVVINKRKKLGLSFNRLTIDRPNNEKTYSKRNMVLACEMCNKMKNNFLTPEETKFIGKKFIASKWRNA